MDYADKVVDTINSDEFISHCKSFIDYTNMIDLNNVKEFPEQLWCENPMLFTGELMLLSVIAPSYKLPRELFDTFMTGYESRKIMYGLYNRRPNDNSRTVSWDEYNGIMYAAYAFANSPKYRDFARTMVTGVVAYGELHNWCYINEEPKNYFKLFDKSTWKYFGRIRQPRDRYFYKAMRRYLCHDINPSMFEHIWLAASIAYDSFDTVEETSGNLMAYFRMMVLKKIKSNNGLINLAHKVFMRNMKKQYGSYPLLEMAKIYFRNEKHPILDLIKAYYVSNYEWEFESR